MKFIVNVFTITQVEFCPSITGVTTNNLADCESALDKTMSNYSTAGHLDA